MFITIIIFGLLQTLLSIYSSTEWVIEKKKESSLTSCCSSVALESSIPNRFWIETLSIVVHLINQLPAQHSDFNSPNLCLYSTHPSYTCYILLCVFALFIRFIINVINLLLNLYDVLLWVIILLKRVFIVMMVLLIIFLYLFLKGIIFLYLKM